MRVAAVNIATNGSTGKIMLGVAEVADERGHVTHTYSPIQFVRGMKETFPAIPHHTYFGSRTESFVHCYAGSLLGRNGLYSRKGTKQLIRELEAFRPDVIHLHNLHRFCVNLPMLFRYIKQHDIAVVWTLHDCWAFTGNCAHFALAGCDRWQTGCHHCPQPRVYPKMYVDTSKTMYRLKKQWFTGVRNLTVVTPSEWLKELAAQSFLQEYPVKVINNGIDLSAFTPTESTFRDKYGLQDKKVILGVASFWNDRKGLDVFVRLAEHLPDEYRIVLVGSGASAAAAASDRIVHIPHTENQRALAGLYTAADVLVNPTREDTYPTVNLEALACGTPVVTFRTGGSPETIDETCGSVVEMDDIDALEREVVRVCSQAPYSAEACVGRARGFDMFDRFEEYVQLYEEVLDR